MNPSAQRVAARWMAASSDFDLKSLEFSSGQEPEIGGDTDFATSFSVEFTVGGAMLAKMLGKQQRVMDRAIESVTERQALNLLMDSKVGKGILDQLFPKAKKRMQDYLMDEGEEDVGMKLSKPDFQWDSDGSYNTAKVDTRNGTVTFEMDVEALGEWV